MYIETIKTLLLVDRILKLLREHLCIDQALITYCQTCRKNSFVRLKKRFNGIEIVTIFACPKCMHTFEKAEGISTTNPSDEHRELIETLKTQYNVNFDDSKPVLTIKRDKRSGPGFTNDY